MSELKYKVGDKVLIKSIDWYNKNKDKYGTIYTSNGFCFCDDMTKHCGEIMKIIDIIVDPKDSNQGYYIMDNVKKWTDEMIEGLVEEECPQDFIEKYCNSCGTQRCDRTKEYLHGCPYYNAYMCIKQNNDIEEETKPKPKFKVGDIVKWYNHTCNITSIGTDENTYIYLIKHDDYREDKTFAKWVHESELTFEDDEETKPLTYEETVEIIQAMQGIGDSWECPQGYQFVDENGNVINATKIVLEKKGKKYPKTYEECCKVLGVNPDNFLSIRNLYRDDGDEELTDYERDLLGKFDSLWELRICRDAYWKIAGEEMKLGKPWEPDWDDGELKWCMSYSGNCIEFDQYKSIHHVLAFPTEEMRDAFYEVFREEIEKCKELL